MIHTKWDVIDLAGGDYMTSRKCSTCAYGERCNIDLFFCNKRGTPMFGSHAFEEISDCIHWTSEEAFGSGKCSECRFSEYDAEEETFTCYCDHVRLFSRPEHEKERKNCSFCSPKPKETSESRASQQSEEKTSLFTPR